VEYIDTDTLQLAACHKGYAGKAGATVERILADRRYACGDVDTG